MWEALKALLGLLAGIVKPRPGPDVAPIPVPNKK